LIIKFAVMNPIEFFENQVLQWNANKTCNFGVEFHAPMIESGINVTRAKGDFLHLFLTDLSVNNITERSGSTGLVRGRISDYSFNLYVLRQGKLGCNTYNEMAGHSRDSSVWETHLKPILKYFGSAEFLDFCQIWNYPVEVTRWQMQCLVNYMDNNYHGWKVGATFRINN